ALAIRLALTYVAVGALMAAFESTKQLIFPSVTVWQSHIVTIFFSSTIATVLVYFIFRHSEPKHNLADQSAALRADDRVHLDKRATALLVVGGLLLVLLPPVAILGIMSRYSSADSCDSPGELRLATTTSTVDSGLLDELI